MKEENINIEQRPNIDPIRTFKVSPSKVINLVMLGKSGCGKTTFLKTLLRLDYIPKETNFVSKTTFPSTTYTILDWNSEYYQLNIIDSPGLFESTKGTIDDTEKKQRTNSSLLELAMTCVDNSVTSVNCFAIVHRQDDVMTPESTQNFIELVALLPDDVRANCCLLLTHCESLTDVARKEKKNKLSKMKP